MGGTQQRQSERVAKLGDRYAARTIPVHIGVDGEQAVLSAPETEEILRVAETIALGLCACRMEAWNCDAPLDTCIVVGRDVCVTSCAANAVSLEARPKS